MSCIHYKLNSVLDYKTLTFDGLHISVGDLKREIQEKEKIGSRGAFDLVLTNAQTKRLYKEDSELIPRNSSVTVARIPAADQKKLPKIQGNHITEGSVAQTKMVAGGGKGVPVSTTMFEDRKGLANSDMTEEEKIEKSIQISTEPYSREHFKSRNSLMTGPPPPTYICNRCNKSGHWIKNCPMQNVKRTTGIMSSELMKTTSDDPMAYMNTRGEWVVPIMHKAAYMKGKKERPPFMEEEQPETAEQEQEVSRPKIPPELLCNLCNDLLKDAVMILCCGDSYCDDCIRPKLMDANSNRECPHCQETGISPDSLVPNAKLRQAVQNFQNETGYSHYKKRQRDNLMKFSIPASGSAGQSTGGNPVTTFAAPLQALLNRFMQPNQSATGSSSTPPAGASPVQPAEGSPSRQTVEPPVPVSQTVASVPPVQAVAPQPVSLPLPITQPAPVHTLLPPTVIVQKPPLAAVAPIQIQPYNVHPAPVAVAVRPSVLPPQQLSSTSTLAPPGVPFHQHLANIAPPGVTPPPVSGTGPVLSQPPPPGLVTQPQPPGVFLGDQRSRSPKLPGTDAWDEYLARKDQKRHREDSSSSSSESSSSSFSRSRSRSRSRRRSPHRDRSARTRRRRRSYSRTRSRSRTPPRRRRHRSPRTPSPDWAAVAAASGRAPFYGHHRTERARRPRSPPEWYFYAGGSKRGPHHSHFLHSLASASSGPRGGAYQPHHEPYNQTMPHQGGPRFHVTSGNHGSAGFSSHHPASTHRGSFQPHVSSHKAWQPSGAVVDVPRAMEEPPKEDGPAKEFKEKEEGEKKETVKEKSTKTLAKMEKKQETETEEKRPPKRKLKKTNSGEKKKAKKDGEPSGKEKKKKKIKKLKSSQSAQSDEPKKEKEASPTKPKSQADDGLQVEDVPAETKPSESDIPVMPDVQKAIEPPQEESKSMELGAAPKAELESVEEKVTSKKRKPSPQEVAVPEKVSKARRSSGSKKGEKRETEQREDTQSNRQGDKEKGREKHHSATSIKPKESRERRSPKRDHRKKQETAEKGPEDVKARRSSRGSQDIVKSAETTEQLGTEKKTDDQKSRSRTYNKERSGDSGRHSSRRGDSKTVSPPLHDKLAPSQLKVEALKEPLPEKKKDVPSGSRVRNETSFIPEEESRHTGKDRHHRHRHHYEDKEKSRHKHGDDSGISMELEPQKEVKEPKKEKEDVPQQPLWQLGRKSKSSSSEDQRQGRPAASSATSRTTDKDKTEEKRSTDDNIVKEATESRDSADSKKEKKKKKKKAKDKDEKGERKKKHKKDKEKHKSPVSQVGGIPEPALTTGKTDVEVKPERRIDILPEPKPVPLMSFQAAQPKSSGSSIRMQVANPRTMISSRWEHESSESEEEVGGKRSVLHQNIPPRSVKERLGVKREPQPLQQYPVSQSKLSPETLAKAEHAILSKVRKPASSRSSTSLLVTTEKQDRKVSMERGSGSGRRVVSGGGSDKGLSVTVTESSGMLIHSKAKPVTSKGLRRVSHGGENESSGLSGAETDERAASTGSRRSSGSSRPVKLKKAWKNSTDESDSKT